MSAALVMLVSLVIFIVGILPGVGEKIFVGWQMANKWSDPPIVIMVSLIGGIPAYVFLNIAIGYYFGIMYTPALTIAIVAYYQLIHLNTPPADTTKWVEFKVVHPACPCTSFYSR